MATTTTGINHDGLTLPPGSPISPKSVTMISQFQREGKQFDSELTKLPDMMAKVDEEYEEVVIPSKKKAKEEEPPAHFIGSTPCYRFFTAKPNPEILLPTLRTVADATNGGGSGVEERVITTIMNDILVNRLGLKQVYPNLFVGYTGRPPNRRKRIVLSRIDTEKLGMYCCDSEQAQQVLMTLRCFQVQIN